MQTFLPSGYSFSPAKIIDPVLYRNINQSSNINDKILYLAPIILILIMIMGYYLVHSKSKRCSYTLKFLMCISFILIFLCIKPSADSARNDFEYDVTSFRCFKESNLSVIMPNYEKDNLIDINDRTPHSYKLFVNRKDTGSFLHNYPDHSEGIYLGKMVNGKFTPATNQPAVKFYKYYLYIKKHHLENKFTKKVFFKKDAHYSTRNNDPQWILTNKDDVVLHLKDDAHIGQSKIIRK